MSKKILKDVEMGMTWTSYIQAAYGVLKHAGMWEDEMWKLMGHTGMAFHFIVHKGACPSSVTVYDWTNEHLLMMDKIGVCSEVICYDNHTILNTSGIINRDAVSKIKKSIDNDKAVIVWAPTPILEFGIIKGYDDDDRVFFVEACCGGEQDPLMYENLGKSNVPVLFYQLIGEKVNVPEDNMIRASLEFGISEWRKQYHVNPNYGSGRIAYENLLGTLERKDYNPFGLGYILSVYCDSKKNLLQYIKYVNEKDVFKDKLNIAIENYAQISERFEAAAEKIPFNLENKVIDQACIPEVISLLKECMELEEKAINQIEEVLKTLE